MHTPRADHDSTASGSASITLSKTRPASCKGAAGNGRQRVIMPSNGELRDGTRLRDGT